MTFAESINACFSKYAEFNGRATRSEFWWFVLFLMLCHSVLLKVNRADILSSVFSLATLLPILAVGARRLHDTNRSGWWQLFFLVPVVGWVLVVIFAIQDSDPGPNRFDTVA